MGLNALLHRIKPAAGVRTHLGTAAGLWMVVGIGLGIVGMRWCFGTRYPWPFLLAAAGLVMGILKGHLVLGRVAARNAERLLGRGDGRCFFSFLSWGSWGLVLLMMGIGFVLRHSPLPRPFTGCLYVAIGSGLLVGSIPLWRSLGRRRDLAG